jgi:hypothetical protein
VGRPAAGQERWQLMFSLDHVIEDGTYDDFKECVLAIVWLPPPDNGLRKLKHTWTVEASQDLVAMHSISADAILTKTLTEAMKYEIQNRALLRRKKKRDRPFDRRGGESVLHQEWI